MAAWCGQVSTLSFARALSVRSGRQLTPRWVTTRDFELQNPYHTYNKPTLYLQTANDHSCWDLVKYLNQKPFCVLEVVFIL